MSAASRISHLALLLLLLPQLLVLGLGHGVVLCIGSDGHVEVEAASSACCLDAGPEGEAALGEPDCGTCLDLQLALDLREHTGANRHAHGLFANAVALPPDPTPAPTAVLRSAAFGLRPARALAPPHLLCLRSVVLRS